MKKLLLLVVLCCLVAVLGATAGVVSLPSASKTQPKVAALTVAENLTSGKTALAAQNIKGARNFFRDAVAADPNNQEANFYYGVTRIFAVYEESYGTTAGLDSVKEIFDRTGFTFQTFGLYNTEATPPQEGPLSTMPRTGEVINFLRDRLLPELDAALVNLGKVNATFTPTSIAPAALDTYGGNLQADYADALAIKALVNLLKCNLNLLVVYGPDVHIPNIAQAPEQMMTYKQLFIDNADFLKPREASRLGAAKTALVGFIDTFKLASDQLKLRSGTLNHLFVIDVAWDQTTNEPIQTESAGLDEVNEALAMVKASLSGAQEFPGDGPVQDRTIDLSKFFVTDPTKAISIRSKLSDCAGNLAFPDPTLSGLFPLGISVHQDAVAHIGPHVLGLTCADKGAPFLDTGDDYVYIWDDPGFLPEPKSVEISNRGTKELRVSSISLSGPNGSEFTVAPSTLPDSCGSLTPTLAVGASCTVTLNVKRPAVKYGYFDAELVIVSDDPTNPSERITVQGYEVPPVAGQVTGKMKDASTLQGVPGMVWFHETRWGNVVSSAPVDASGNFSITGLSSGTYKVKFTTYDSYYLDQWFQGKYTQESADPVTLTPAAQRLPDVALVKGGVVNGIVKDAATNQGLNWVTVTLFDSQTKQFVASGGTGPTGSFYIPRVPAGIYSLQVGNPGGTWAPTWSTVTVTVGNSSWAGEFLLQPGATITGTVRDAVNQAPIGWVSVEVYNSQTGSLVAETHANFDGVYTMQGLPSGSYKMLFSGNEQGYQKLWHSNASSQATATPVTVTAPGSVTVNAALGRVASTNTSLAAQSNGGTVTLTATVTSGSGIPAGLVEFWKQDTKLGSATLDATGKATLPTQLLPGTHYIYAYYTGNSSYNSSSDEITQVVQQQNFLLSVVNAGDGSGSVNSDPQGIACSKGSSTNCSKSFTGWSQVTLWATPSSGSAFSGWSGACTGSGSCVVTMNGVKSVTATFGLADATVRIDGVSTPYYTLGATLGTINENGKTVRAKNQTFTEHVILNRPYEVMLKGGYSDAAFSTASGFTTLSGSLKIRAGKLRVERLKVR